MNLKRVILFGALLWILIFFEVSILMFGFNLKEGLSFYVIHYIMLIILTAMVSMFYFKKQKVTAAEGLKVGVIFLIISSILDAIITIPLFVKTYSFYSNIYLWIAFLITLLTTTIYGALIKKPAKK